MSKVPLSTRQAQVAELVARGFPNKTIAGNLGLSVRTVEEHIRLAADKVSGDGYPKRRLLLWFFGIEQSTEDG